MPAIRARPRSRKELTLENGLVAGCRPSRGHRGVTPPDAQPCLQIHEYRQHSATAVLGTRFRHQMEYLAPALTQFTHESCRQRRISVCDTTSESIGNSRTQVTSFLGFKTDSAFGDLTHGRRIEVGLVDESYGWTYARSLGGHTSFTEPWLR